MKKLKIAVIGGGSSYTPELIEGFIKRWKELPITEIHLVDIKEGEEKLNIVGALAKRMIEKAEINCEIKYNLDRKEALKNADYVITQLRVGRLEARIKDERIPLSHGVIGQETNGAGGLFKAFRTIPVIFDIIEDMKKYCPDAWLVNFTNPAGIVTEAVIRHTDFKKFVGLCNVPIGMHMGLAELLKVDPKRLEIDFAGLNHMVFGLNFYLDGKKINKEAIDALSKPDAHISMANIMAEPWDSTFTKAMEIMVCPYLRYYYKNKEMLAKDLEKLEEGNVRAEEVKKLETSLFEIYKNPELKEKPVELEQRGGAFYSDAACELINSIHNNKKTIMTVNTKNRGAIANLPYDSAVEVSAVITSEGPKPISMGDLPPQANGIVQDLKAFETIATDAAVSGDYNKAMLAMTMNTLITSDELAKTLLDEMLEAHKEFLPQFKK